VNDDDEQTRTNIHALRGIRRDKLSIEAVKTYASDHAATETDLSLKNAAFYLKKIC
jgi:hypothetical protein